MLLLWDRILGFDSLQVLPLLAATIFAFRKQTLMQVCCSRACKAGGMVDCRAAPRVCPHFLVILSARASQLDSDHAVKAALADLRSILVVPLLQYALFASDVE